MPDTNIVYATCISDSKNNPGDSFDQTAKLNLTEDAKSRLITIAIKCLVDRVTMYYYGNQDYAWLINEENFDAIWNEYPELKIGLIKILIGCYQHNIYYDSKPIFSKEYCSSKLCYIEKMLKDNDDTISDTIRRSIIPVIYPNFDYKSEIISLMKSEDRNTSYNPWIQLASEHSKDEALFEFLLSNIKREDGATEMKVNILNKAFSNGVVCESAIKKIANSSPVSLKRTVVEGLTLIIRQGNTDINYGRFAGENLKAIKEKIDKAENLSMMFASSNDSRILRNLGTSLSVKNLPWILPTAANHPWIVKDIQRRIDKEGV